MRNFLAAVLGGLLGWAGPSLSRVALGDAIASSCQTLRWQAHTLAGWTPGLGTSAVSAVSALAMVLALPAGMLLVAEAARAGRSARTSAVVVLLASALVSFADPGLGNGVYVVGVLAVCALLAAARGGWAQVPLTFLFAAVAGRWALDLAGTRSYLVPSAHALAGVVGGSDHVWVLALLVVSATVLAAAVRFLLGGPRRGARA